VLIDASIDLRRTNGSKFDEGGNHGCRIVDLEASAWARAGQSLPLLVRPQEAFLPIWLGREKLSPQLDIARRVTPSQADNRSLVDTRCIRRSLYRLPTFLERWIRVSTLNASESKPLWVFSNGPRKWNVYACDFHADRSIIATLEPYSNGASELRRLRGIRRRRGSRAPRSSHRSGLPALTPELVVVPIQGSTLQGLRRRACRRGC
jgi:hypothetical protein